LAKDAKAKRSILTWNLTEANSKAEDANGRNDRKDANDTQGRRDENLSRTAERAHVPEMLGWDRAE